MRPLQRGQNDVRIRRLGPATGVVKSTPAPPTEEQSLCPGEKTKAESSTQLESEHLHVPLGKETAVCRKFIGFRQFHYPLFQGSDLGIHGVDHLKHGGSLEPHTQTVTPE